jgi:hypothetical protein
MVRDFERTAGRSFLERLKRSELQFDEALETETGGFSWMKGFFTDE